MHPQERETTDRSPFELSAKKSLGQHFLRSKKVLRVVAEAAKLCPNELVLEIGPGEGTLTQVLLELGVIVVAVETDSRAVELLHKRFKDAIRAQRLLLIEGDIRETVVQQKIFHDQFLGNKPYKLVANIPYYITGYLFRLFLEQLTQPEQIVFLIQHEVAEQITSVNGKEGLLSLSIKTYGTPLYIAKVRRNEFVPPPKIDSAIISIRDIHQPFLNTAASEHYFNVLKAGLSSKRKMLIGNLSSVLHIPRKDIEKIFTTIGIPTTVRGEDLGVAVWQSLAAHLEKT